RLVSPSVTGWLGFALFRFLRQSTIMCNPSRYTENDLRVLKRDQLETFICAEIIERFAVRLRLPQLVVAELFFESWGDGDKRRHPVWLFFLYARDARKPIREVLYNRRKRGRVICRRRRIRNCSSCRARSCHGLSVTGQGKEKGRSCANNRNGAN